MNEETQIISKPRYEEHKAGSHFLNVSIRGWLALILTLTVCLLAGLQIEVKEPLYTIAVMALSFYFNAVKDKPKTPTQGTP